MNNTKIDLINAAYERMRISGMTVNPGARENTLALARLEKMAARWKNRNICSDYNFETEPDLNSDSGVPLEYQDAFEANLAVSLCAEYGKTPTQALLIDQQGTLSSIISSTAVVKPTRYPTRQPIGSGNTVGWGRYQNYYHLKKEAPVSCSTVKMISGNTNDFRENYGSYLRDTEQITSYTIDSDTGLNIISDSLESPDINYRVNADGNGVGFLQVKIEITTDTGRINTRIINFEVI